MVTGFATRAGTNHPLNRTLGISGLNQSLVKDLPRELGISGLNQSLVKDLPRELGISGLNQSLVKDLHRYLARKWSVSTK